MAHRKVAGFRHIGGDEAHSALLELEEEGCVAAEAVELGDHQCCTRHLCVVKSLLQLRPVVALAALHLRVSSRAGRSGLAELPTAARCASRPNPERPWVAVETR
jgi:hypothetical protein